MFKWISLVASVMTIALLVVTQPALASVDIDGTPWDMEFDGVGHPAAQGWQTFGYSSSTYKADFKLGTGALEGWHTSNGNAGGGIGKVPNTVLRVCARLTPQIESITVHCGVTGAGWCSSNRDRLAGAPD